MPDRSIAADDDGRRLDRVLRTAFPNVPPGAIAAAIRKGAVRLDGRRCSSATRVKLGETVTYPQWRDTGESTVPSAHQPRHDGARNRAVYLRDGEIVARGWRAPILQRSDHWIAINKPAGVASYGADGVDNDLRALAAREGWWRESMSFRPGPVHRLDFATSGAQLFSLTAEGARALTEQFRRRRTFKLYLALAAGVLEKPIEIDRRLTYDRATRTALVEGEGRATVGFRSALTRVTPIARSQKGNASLLLAVPESGRTHQVRAHLASIGHPLLADRKYGGPAWSEVDLSSGYAPPGISGELFVLHALVLAVGADGTIIEEPLLVNATLSPDARAIVGHLFGDLDSYTAAITAHLAEACTVCRSGATIRL